MISAFPETLMRLIVSFCISPSIILPNNWLNKFGLVESTCWIRNDLPSSLKLFTDFFPTTILIFLAVACERLDHKTGLLKSCNNESLEVIDEESQMAWRFFL